LTVEREAEVTSAGAAGVIYERNKVGMGRSYVVVLMQLSLLTINIPWIYADINVRCRSFYITIKI